ncbi:MAG: TonB-dependent outerrane ferripyoverdine receptor [Pseudomonas sp.]|nr:TonB-dependent outerrane ferripyoverdine receptor [Pseudomonas sp.]
MSWVRVEQAEAFANLLARYAISSNLTAPVNLNNVFDREYDSSQALAGDYGAPRNIMTSFKYDFCRWDSASDRQTAQQMNFSSPLICAAVGTVRSLIQETTVCPPSRGLFFAFYLGVLVYAGKVVNDYGCCLNLRGALATFASKPAPTGLCVIAVLLPDAGPCRSWLASEGRKR